MTYIYTLPACFTVIDLSANDDKYLAYFTVVYDVEMCLQTTTEHLIIE